LFPIGILHGTGRIRKTDARGKSHFGPLGFPLADCDIDIVRVAQLLFLTALLALKEPRLGMFDASHRLHDFQADGSPNILNHRLVVETGIRINGKLATQLIEQLDHFLRAQIELAQMFVNRKPQRRCSSSSAMHGVLPFLLALI
jgi:hypothetical protein